MKHYYYDNSGNLIDEIDEADFEVSSTQGETTLSDLDEMRLAMAELAELVTASTTNDTTTTEGSTT